MATKGKGSDEGGSGAERKGRVPDAAEENRQAESPYGDTDIERDIEELEREGLAAGGRKDVDNALGRTAAGRREEIASNPDNEEELAEEALASSSEDEDEAQTHDRKRR
jgi:hypothetical protein